MNDREGEAFVEGRFSGEVVHVQHGGDYATKARRPARCRRASATMPGVNGFIAFSASTTSGTQLFTVRPDGKDLYQITHVAGDAVNVDWSPDGRRLVFAIGNETSAKIAAEPARCGHRRPSPDFVPDRAIESGSST